MMQESWHKSTTVLVWKSVKIFYFLKSFSKQCVERVREIHSPKQSRPRARCCLDAGRITCMASPLMEFKQPIPWCKKVLPYASNSISVGQNLSFKKKTRLHFFFTLEKCHQNFCSGKSFPSKFPLNSFGNKTHEESFTDDEMHIPTI